MMRPSLLRGGIAAAGALLLLTFFAPAPAHAQDDLARAYSRVTREWARGNASGVAALTANASLDLHDGPLGPLGTRQVGAVLRRLFDNMETVEVQRGMLERVGGTPPRAFGSITWTVRVNGTEQPRRHTVYFALARIGEEWLVTEIRLIR